MYLNSFCVQAIKDGFVIDYTKPSDFDTAKKNYGMFLKKYYKTELGTTEYGMCNKMIKKSIMDWQGDTRMVERWLLSLRWQQISNGITIELLHSSLT